MIRILLAFLIVITLVSCKKSKEATPTLVGYWQGNYGNNTQVPSHPFSLLFRDNGTVRVYDYTTDTASGVKGEGIYYVVDSSVITRFAFNIGSDFYSTVADVDVAFKKMEGIFRIHYSSGSLGTFKVFKK